MIHSLLTQIGSALISLGMMLGVVAAPVTPTTFGAVTPVGASQFTLAGAGINSTQSTIQLTSFTTPDGRPITMSMLGTIGYGALEPQTVSKIEDITFSGVSQNVNGTATLTGVTRGNDFVTPYAASTTLAHAHAGGATFILTNTAGFYTQFASLTNTEAITGVWTFASTSAPKYDANYTASGNQFVSFNQLNNVVLQGAATSTESALGLVQLSSGANTGLGTASSTSGAPIVIENKFATTTPGTLCTGGAWNCIVATVNGAILTTSSFFNNLLAAANTWSATNTFSAGYIATASSTLMATTSIAASNVLSNALKLNTVPYAFPSSGIASSTHWAFDLTGKAVYAPDQAYAAGQFSTTTSSIGTIIVTHSMGAIPKHIHMYAACKGGSNSSYGASEGDFIAPSTNTSTYNYLSSAGATTLGQSGSNIVNILEDGTSAVLAAISAVSATTFTLNVTTNTGCGNTTTYFQWNAEL